MDFDEYPDAEFEDLWYRKLEEACLKYSPDLVWFDMGLELLSDNIRKKAYARILNLAKERNQEVGISYKINLIFVFHLLQDFRFLKRALYRIARRCMVNRYCFRRLVLQWNKVAFSQCYD